MIRLLRGLTFYRFVASSNPAPVVSQTTASGKDKYRGFHKNGPQLFITKMLMINGPLTNKELWRMYERKLHESKLKNLEPDFEYWPSLTQMKRTLKFMRINEKIKSNGYNPKNHQFNGWKIQEKRALKFVHPVVIYQIQQEIGKKENL